MVHHISYIKSGTMGPKLFADKMQTVNIIISFSSVCLLISPVITILASTCQEGGIIKSQ